MKREEKAKVISEVADKLTKAKGMVLADFTGMTVEEVNELRKECRKEKVEYRVVKNTLARIAMENAGGFDELKKYLEGPTAIAFGYDDPVIPAKLIKKFIDKIEKPSVKAIFIEGVVYDGSKIDEIAKLPSKSEIMSGIIGSISAPINGVVGAINAVIRDLILVIDAIAKKKEESQKQN